MRPEGRVEAVDQGPGTGGTTYGSTVCSGLTTPSVSVCAGKTTRPARAEMSACAGLGFKLLRIARL